VKSGFGIIEVMIALAMLMVCALAAFRTIQVCMHAAHYSETMSRAAVLCRTQAASLWAEPQASPALSPGWHKDPANPIIEGGMTFYRFWSVQEAELGLRTRVYVAWSEKGRAASCEFDSEEEAEASVQPKVTMSGLIPSWP